MDKLKRITLAGALITLVGCSTPEVTRVDTSGTRTLTTTRGINMQDWNTAADEMIQSLRSEFINSGRLQTPPDRPALLAISKIVNDTGIHINQDMLVKRIRVALLESGKVVTSTTIGLNGAEDPIAEEERRRMRAEGVEPSRPDYTLSGKIIEQLTRAGSTTEAAYVFQLTLTKNPEGFGVWEAERSIAKQGKRGAVAVW